MWFWFSRELGVKIKDKILTKYSGFGDLHVGPSFLDLSSAHSEKYEKKVWAIFIKAFENLYEHPSTDFKAVRCSF